MIVYVFGQVVAVVGVVVPCWISELRCLIDVAFFFSCAL